MEKDFRLRLFHWIVRNIFRHADHMILPKYLVVLGFILMPIRAIRYRPNQECFYDMSSDTFTIYGMKYTGGLFRNLAVGGLAVGKWMRIVKREDGTITMETVSPQVQEQFDALLEFEENRLRSHAKLEGA